MFVIVRLLLGFIAGALSVLIFHQPTIYGLTQLGLINGNIYQMGAVGPLGIPQIANQCFWGGLWGMLFVLLWDRQGWGTRGSLFGMVFGLFAGLILWGALQGAVGDLKAVAVALPFGLVLAALLILIGPEVLFGMVFGIMGPAMVNWVVLPLIRGQPLFGAGSAGAIGRTALIGAMFGLGMALILSLIERLGGRRG
ncbi:hypothetical protein E8L99_23055 [Phreatobacter aquaticus]|uniref:Uncharacterized protein n=1 Tax=Phreatobacter aquaticus TaxID=2570229 RepID=A0A4D7QL35_9HYPH|nr:hypothetical protein [Phreatobacter aquaticus]QCK88430.1 hypothetical protein E8L99_23055 [Phreatobacter aquaticus]